jgi:Flavin containing amine oxidoreductase
MVRCVNGDVHDCDTVILTAPVPLLKEIVLPPQERERAAAVRHIGFGNVIKILVCTENFIRVDVAPESPKLAE